MTSTADAAVDARMVVRCDDHVGAFAERALRAGEADAGAAAEDDDRPQPAIAMAPRRRSADAGPDNPVAVRAPPAAPGPGNIGVLAVAWTLLFRSAEEGT